MKRLHPETRFLLLDLSDADAALVGQGLRAAGAAVACAAYDGHGRHLVRTNAYDMILLALRDRRDAALAPIEFCRLHGGNAGIVALIPVPKVAQIVRIIDSGADDCVPIPFHPEELLARSCAIARRVRRRQPDELFIRVHDLEIDLIARRVRRGDRRIDLTGREYALLQLLASCLGTVVSRSTIRQHLYGRRPGKASNVVDVYIRYLRAKIDQGFALPLILTRRGEGYLLRGGSGESNGRISRGAIDPPTGPAER